METGLESYYIMQNNKKLRYGYTTGSCAAAAAKAAVMMLLTGQKVKHVDLMTPKKILLHLEILEGQTGAKQASCAVRKDGGDDPDATHGLLVYAAVRKIEKPVIEIDGGEGVGRVTKEGLEQPVGAAAINRVPRQMIEEAVKEICEEQEYFEGIRVEIFVPGGEAVAERTFNPRLGIIGGISILGTSGIVVPMSEAALIASIRLEMQMRHANGAEYLLITPGNYGADFLRKKTTLDVENSMKCSNFVGETLDMAAEIGIKGILFVAHIGKFIKVSGGIMNTHSRNADSRAELLAAQALRTGADLKLVKSLLAAITTEEAVEILKKTEFLEPTMEQTCEKIHGYLQHRCQGNLQTEVILFSNSLGYLGETRGAEEMIKYFEIKGEEK